MTDLFHSSVNQEMRLAYKRQETYNRQKTFGSRLAGNQFNSTNNSYLDTKFYSSYQPSAYKQNLYNKIYKSTTREVNLHRLTSHLQMLLLQEKQGKIYLLFSCKNESIFYAINNKALFCIRYNIF